MVAGGSSNEDEEVEVRSVESGTDKREEGTYEVASPGEEEEEEEVEVDPEEQEEPGRAPSPLLVKVMETAMAFKAAVTGSVWAVSDTDVDPEPFDQNTLLDISEEVEAVEEFCGARRTELEMWRQHDYDEDLHVLRDPPGYPMGTFRFGPLTADKIEIVKDRRVWPFDNYKEVKAREGIILYAWREKYETLPGQLGYVDPDDPSLKDEGESQAFTSDKVGEGKRVNHAKAEDPSRQDDDWIDLVALYHAEPPRVQSRPKAGPSNGDRFPKENKQ